MTYFGFLLRFLVVPIVVLGLLLLRDRQAGRTLPATLLRRPAWLAVVLHMAVALIYTTPWDNYLVATQVWWYDSARVTGLTIGWVPVEEYTFFLLQPLLAGLWLLWSARRLLVPVQPAPSRPDVRRVALVGLGVLWTAAAAILVADWQPGRYLALELVWMVPPMLPQVALGAHVLWQQRRLVAVGILVPTLYLATADALSIADGVWTISPQYTTGLLLGGVLPVEELVFFLLTNTLVIFGITLLLALGDETQRVLVEAWRSIRAAGP